MGNGVQIDGRIPVKAKTSLSAGKALTTVLLDVKDVMYVELLL